jgi:hypothetical protein
MPGFTYWFHSVKQAGTFHPFISQHYFSLVSHQIRFYFSHYFYIYQVRYCN